jgi:hypothetical protein
MGATAKGLTFAACLCAAVFMGQFWRKLYPELKWKRRERIDGQSCVRQFGKSLLPT